MALEKRERAGIINDEATQSLEKTKVSAASPSNNALTLAQDDVDTLDQPTEYVKNPPMDPIGGPSLFVY